MEDKKMKFTKTLASIAAATIAVSSLAVSAFAADALVSMTVPEDSKPQDAGQVNLWELPFDDSVEAWAGKVDKAVATITTEAYANGALGGNTVANNGWASSDQIESSEAGTHQWVWDSIGGLQTQDADGKSNGYFKVEVWWMNALGEKGNQTPATLTIDKVDFYDKAGDLLATYPAAADTDTKPAEPKPIQTKADISFTDKKTPSYTYTVKGDIDTLNVDVALSADAAAAQAGWNDWCSAGVAVKNPDGTVKYYQWGGASVNWSWDVDGDNVGETKDGVGTETWVGTVGADGGQISIPVVKGAVVDFYCLSWDTYNGVQYTLTINDEEAAVEPGEPEEPTKPGEPEEPTKPGETEDPAEPGESSGDVNPGECSGEPVNPPTGAAVAVIPAVLAAAAVATTGIVLKKRSK